MQRELQIWSAGEVPRQPGGYNATVSWGVLEVTFNIKHYLSQQVLVFFKWNKNSNSLTNIMWNSSQRIQKREFSLCSADSEQVGSYGLSNFHKKPCGIIIRYDCTLRQIMYSLFCFFACRHSYHSCVGRGEWARRIHVLK